MSLQNALLDAFDVSSLEQLLVFRLGKRLDSIVARNQPMREIMFSLIMVAQREGWLDQLIENAHNVNPGNGKLAEAYFAYLGGTKVQPPVDEPASRKSVRTPIFSHAEILEIASVLQIANLVTEESMQALQGGMNRDFRASLPSTGELRFRLMNTLHILNSTGELQGGEVPFETFLANAAYLAKPRPEAVAFEKCLQQLRR
jgi:hypothetical protein